MFERGNRQTMQLAERSDDGVSANHFSPGTGSPGEPPRTAAHNLFAAALIQQLPALRARAMRLELAASEADDLVQDTIEKALRSWRMFQPGTNLRAWLYTVMQNLFFDRCRSRNRLAFLHEACARHAADNPDDDRPPWLKASPDDIRELAAEMPPALAEALELVFFQGLSYVEAARRLGIRVPTVGTRLVRARAYLRSRLQKQLARRGSRLGKYVS
jgi:RNA polymerase sigma-70 factor (ECF subfamily)